MNESGEKNNKTNSDSEKKADNGKLEEISLDLDFAPSWARTSPEEHIKSVKNSRFDNGQDSYGRRDKRRSGRRDSWRDNRDDRFSRRDRDGKRGNRKPRHRDDERNDSHKPSSRGDSSGAPAAFDSHSSRSGDVPGYDNSNANRSGGDRGRYRGHPRSEHPPLPIEIRVLPEQKALGGVIRRIQSSHRAFPLRDIAWLFLDKPASCLIRLAQQKDNPIPLYQCKVCGIPALTEEEIQNHLVNRHLDEFFDVEEIECEPPSGQFVCVMRCGITGELLGPPNHHSYNTKVHEMLRTKFPNMPEESYRRKIESVREADLIEEWRQSCTKKNIYRRKTAEVVPPVNDEKKPQPSEGKAAPETNETAPEPDSETEMPAAPEEASTAAQEEVEVAPAAAETDAAPAAEAEISAEDSEVKAPPMERDVAELVFKREMLADQFAAVKHLVCIASTALQTPSKQLYFAIKDMIYKERRFPTSLFFALRGAFRHRKLHLFRAKEAKGPDFVMQKKPVELDPSHAVDMVKDVIAYIHENPACTKAEMVRALAGTEEAKIKEVLGQLAWLIEKGNVIEYYNDVLSAPLEFPAFRLLPGEKKRGGKRSESVAAAAVVGEEKQAPAPSQKTKKKAESKKAPVVEETKESPAEPPAEKKTAAEEKPDKPSADEKPVADEKAEKPSVDEKPVADEKPVVEEKAEEPSAKADEKKPE